MTKLLSIHPANAARLLLAVAAALCSVVGVAPLRTARTAAEPRYIFLGLGQPQAQIGDVQPLAAQLPPAQPTPEMEPTGQAMPIALTQPTAQPPILPPVLPTEPPPAVAAVEAPAPAEPAPVEAHAPNLAPSSPDDNPGYTAAVEPGCDAACAAESARLAAAFAAEREYERKVREMYASYEPRAPNLEPSSPDGNPGFDASVEPGGMPPLPTDAQPDPLHTTTEHVQRSINNAIDSVQP